MLAQADALCLERRFEEAATIYQQLVTMAEFRLGPNHPDAILVLQRLADSLYAMNLFRDCLPLYERLCNVARGMLGDADPDVINLMFKIAKTQELIGAFAEARATYQFAISTAVANLPPGHELTNQLQQRYHDLVERMEENQQAAQAWKENTVTNPIIKMGPDGRPIPPALMAPQPMPPAQMPPLQQIPPGVGLPQASQLPPHLINTGMAPPEAMPGTPFDTIPPSGIGFNSGQPSHPEGSPFADSAQPPSSSYNGSEPAHPPGSPFGAPEAPPQQHYSAPPAMAPLSAPPPVMSSQQGPPSNPWDPDPSSMPGASSGFPPLPQQSMLPPSSQPAVSPPSYDQQMPPQSQQMTPPLPQMMPPQPQMAPPQPQQMMPPQPQLAPPQQMMPPPQQIPPPMQPPMAPPQPQFPPLPQSSPFPPSPQSMPPPPQQLYGGPGGAPGASPPGGTQEQWNSVPGEGQPQSSVSSGSIGSQIMQQLEFGNNMNSMPSSQFPSNQSSSLPGMAPNMMPPDGNGNPGFNSQGLPPGGLPPSGLPPLPQSSVGYPPSGVMQDPFRPSSYDQGPPSIRNPNMPESEQGGLYTAGPEPIRNLDGGFPSPLHQAGMVKGGPIPVNDPFSETGRKNNPDPYLEHLAAKVADLKAQKAQSTEFDEPPRPSGRAVQSSGWHDAISIPASERALSQEMRKQGPPPVLFDEGTGYGDSNANLYEEFEERDRDRERAAPNTKIKSSRVAASKSEDLVSNVRAFKEYLIPVVVILVIGIGGYFFLSTTTARPPSKTDEVVAPVTPGKPGAPEKKTVYATADNTMRLAVGTRDCSLVDGKTLINVPCVLYDGSWSHAAMQIVDSVLEKQIWFNQMPEGMVTENGTILFDTKAPDRLVMDQMNAMSLAANSSFLRGANYPTKQAHINSQTFFYRNPFTGQSNFVKLQIIHEVNGNRQEIMDSMLNGALILGEPKFGRGDVRCYAMSDASGGTEKGLGFFVRGADRNGNLFRVSNNGQAVLLGFVEGKDVSNSHIQVTDTLTPTTPEKPTKVWIAKGQQLPIFVIYHSMPISMAIIAFLTFWRSLMVAPGQDPNNSLNRSFRIVSYIAIGIGVITSIIQYTYWM